jgi:hypothetical protein
MAGFPGCVFRALGFSAQSFRSAETHVGFHEKCLLFLSDFDKN